MILFMGAITKGYFVEEICSSRQISFAYVKESKDIKEHTESILGYEDLEYAVYDIEQYINSSSVIADNILSVMRSKNVKPVILASAFSKDSNLIRTLYNAGIKAYIFSISATGKKTDFLNFLSDYYQYAESTSANLIPSDWEPDEAEELDAEDNEPIEPLQKYARSIAFAGAMHRIGTTTQALQVAKLYLLMGLRPCYISLAEDEFVQNIERYIDNREVNETLSMVRYENVDMYYNLDKLPEILAMDYDCFIYDFGVFGSSTFNRLSFLEKDISFLVCGGKPSEILNTTRILENSFYKNVKYVFSFISKGDQENILELMEELSDQTYFTEYVPDPFSYSVSSDFYKDLIGFEEPKKNKKVSWKFWKKGSKLNLREA
jgi:hypothetical protein